MLILKAKYLLTGPENVINNGAVIIENEKIAFAGCDKDVNNSGSSETVDLGNSAIIPGLINAHTHLELTNLHGRIKYNGSYTDWVKQIIEVRKTWEEDEYRSSMRKGIAKSIEAGTTTVGDIIGNGFGLDELNKSKLRKYIFHELIDFNPSTAEKTMEGFKNKINGFKNTPLLNIGISPHAPFTVSKELYGLCGKVSKELDIRTATHLAETEEEVEFLTKGTGSLAALLNSRNMLNNWACPGVRPIIYLSGMGILRNSSLLIHCNYVSEEEINAIKKSDSSVVFCPGSHKFFKHKGHPFRTLLENDINVALGTDSLASNNSLSILDEMKFLYEEHKDIKPQTILYMGTIAGAKALGLEKKIGRLETGYDADITVIKLPEQESDNIYHNIFSQDSESIFTVIAGSICYDNDSCFENKE